MIEVIIMSMILSMIISAGYFVWRGLMIFRNFLKYKKFEADEKRFLKACKKAGYNYFN